MRRAAILWLFLAPGMAVAEGCGALLAALNGAARLEGAECGAGQTTNGKIRHCQIAYDYRSPAAEARFAALIDSILQCLPDAVKRAPAPGVNHPDTHIERIFDADGAQITVSLKDKAQLGKTFVFLQVTRGNSGE